MSMDLGLRGKIALVTGASEGIGARIAFCLAAEGVKVAICARNLEKLKRTASEIERATGSQVVPISADMRSKEGCENFVREAVSKLGAIDILVNNAGAKTLGNVIDVPDEAFVDAINGKLLGCIRCSREAVPHLKRRGGGLIVNITGATQQAVPGHAVGGSCYAAMRFFTKTLCLELNGTGIRVNSVAPGRIQTEEWERTMSSAARARNMTPEALKAERVSVIPAGRMGTGDDIGAVICFLASEHGSYVNGVSIPVDGGRSQVI